MNSIKNSDLQLTMMVKKDDFKMDWVEMKIPLQLIVDLAFIHQFFFEKDEVITVYLGDVLEYGEKVYYDFLFKWKT